jgi:hypothetical protein
MKTTVKTINVKYSQDVNTITCDLLSEVQFMNVKNMDVFLDIPEVYAYVSSLVDSKGRYVVHTRGTARCLETDEFNYETGRRIAHTKAQSKIFRIANEFFATINDRATQDLMRCECNCVASEWQCYDHIDALSGINHDEVELEEIDE